MSEAGETKVIRTVCGIEDGSSGGILAHVKDGKLVKVEPADVHVPWMRHSCAKGLCSIKMVRAQTIQQSDYQLSWYIWKNIIVLTMPLNGRNRFRAGRVKRKRR